MRAFFLVLLLSLLAACRKDTIEEVPSTESTRRLPVVTDTSTNVLLTWIDDRGEFHTEQNVKDVPEAAREKVRVIDATKEDPGAEQVFLADLRTANAGVYPVRLASRTEFEEIAVTRRKARGVSLAAAPAAPPGLTTDAAAPANAKSQVIIYGASWCGPCHQAADYLKSKGVPYVLHDIEKEPDAAREMHAKLAKVGKSGGSIPVIDIHGTLMVGFERHQVDRLLAL